MLVSLIFATVATATDTCAMSTSRSWWGGETKVCAGSCDQWEMPDPDHLDKATKNVIAQQLYAQKWQQLANYGYSQGVLDGLRSMDESLFTAALKEVRMMGTVIVPRMCGYGCGSEFPPLTGALGCHCCRDWARVKVRRTHSSCNVMRRRAESEVPGGERRRAEVPCECTDWQCTCQGLSDSKAVNAHVSWGTAHATAQAWWIANSCETFESTFCYDWGCTCQGLSDTYLTFAHVTWGDATPNAKTWWSTKKCETQPDPSITENRRRVETPRLERRLEQAVGETTTETASNQGAGEEQGDYDAMIAAMDANQEAQLP